MARSHLKGNPELVRVIRELRAAARSHDAPLWASVADGLERARHPSRPVSIGHLERIASSEETVVVPGKVLSDGSLSKRLTVAAFAYSTEARAKIHAAGGTALSLHDLLKAKPDGAGVRLVG
ncbi:MAG TPA: 50S ribosomal protein L18e [Thermoplasmata archaeon]|nr:50S ribosomal protein L18e [Thermoplasmata archaeon]